VDVIADKFFEFKGKKARAKSFTPKKGAELSLSIGYETYDAILTHLAELDEEPQVCFISSIILNSC
jgi:phage protein D